MVAMAAAPEQEQEITLGPRISSNEAEYGEIADFLFDEAALLDGDRHKEWLELTTEDVVYIMPVRRSLYRKEGRGIDYRSVHNEDDRGTLAQRVRHIVEAPSARHREPPPRMRRQVSNIVVHKGDQENEYLVNSNIVLFRNRFRDPTYDILTAERHDVIRRTSEGLRLANRQILVDQAMLGGSYIDVFL